VSYYYGFFGPGGFIEGGSFQPVTNFPYMNAGMLLGGSFLESYS